MKAPAFRSLRVADIKPADYNPPSRVHKENIRDLLDSMSRNGLIYPILVTDGNKLIDGHRRLAAAKELGWDVIPAIVTEAAPDEVYATVNATAKKMGGSDALNVWLKRPAAVTKLMAARFENMLTVIGPQRVDKIAKAGYSLRVFNRAMQVAKYCERDEDYETVCAVVDWFLTWPMLGVVGQAMAMGEQPATILAAVRKNRPLKMRATVG